MVLREEIEQIRDDALSRLNDAHDYLTFTRGAWRTLQQAVYGDGLKFSWQSRSTGADVDEQSVLARA